MIKRKQKNGEAITPKQHRIINLAFNLMSAFIVENKTIDRIINYFENEYIKGGYIKRILDMTHLNLPDDFEKLGQLMLTLNTMAVNYRYGENQKPPIYKFKKMPPPDKIQALKSLQCFLYQCSEGEQFENSRLFRILEKAMRWIMKEIVISLPAYQRAEWG